MTESAMCCERSMIMGKQIPIYPMNFLVPSIKKETFSILPFNQAFSSATVDVYSPHRHDMYEIFLITEGQGTLWIDFQAYSLTPPVLCLIPPGQVHAWKIVGYGSGSLIFLTRGFFVESAENSTDLLELSFLNTPDRGSLIPIPKQQVSDMVWLCNKLEQEIETPRLDQDAMLHSSINLLLIEAHRTAMGIQSTPRDEKTPVSLLTKRFLQLVETRFLLTSSLEDYATFLHVTTNHLTETIKQATGKPAGRIIRERLLMEAKRLLQYSDMSTSEIAYKLGFEDASYFSRFFRKYTSLSPSGFRASFQRVLAVRPGNRPVV